MNTGSLKFIVKLAKNVFLDLKKDKVMMKSTQHMIGKKLAIKAPNVFLWRLPCNQNQNREMETNLNVKSTRNLFKLAQIKMNTGCWRFIVKLAENVFRDFMKDKVRMKSKQL